MPPQIKLRHVCPTSEGTVGVRLIYGLDLGRAKRNAALRVRNRTRSSCFAQKHTSAVEFANDRSSSCDFILFAMVKAKSGDEGSARLREKGRKCLKKTLKLPYLKALWRFLMADSYMYGPLLYPPHAGGEGVLRLTEPVLRKEIRRKNKFRISRTVRSGPHVVRDVQLRKSEDANQTKTTHQVSQSTFSYLNIQHGVATPDTHERALMRSKEGGNGASILSSHEDSETEDTSMADMSSRSDEVSSLEAHEAEKVVSKLVKKFGGRYPKELGIEVDKGDEEVEKWFLAAALFNHSITFELSRQTFKNVLNSGISKMSDTLGMDQEQLAEILEKAGYTSYPERTAARLQRLATQLKTEYGGSICSLKTVTDPSELGRQLGGLFGISQSSIRTYLRELRGVWPGVTSEYDGRAKNAARHLGLAGCSISSPGSNRKSGVETDHRDVEAALTKLALVHARHYRECSGGLHCQMLEDDPVVA